MGYLHLLNISTEPGVENSAKVFKKSFIYYVLINLCFTLLKGVYSNYVTMVFLTILLISNKLSLLLGFVYGGFVAKSCPTLVTIWTVRDLPGFSVHGIFQARILERVVISFSSAAAAWAGQ